MDRRDYVDSRDVCEPIDMVEADVKQRPIQRIVEAAALAIGVALIAAAALLLNQSWLDRHFLPSFFVPRVWYVRIETIARLTIGAVGAALALPLRRRLARTVPFSPWSAVSVAIAVILALAAGELVLRRTRMQPAAWLFSQEEPRRRPDATLGWTLVPARTAWNTIAGRRIEYAIDAGGYRVRRVDEPVDRERPTMLFAGESVMFGEGLTWDESIPAQVAAMTGIQGANLAVHGYGSDQAYRRLEAEVPRFRRPVAIVSLFMTALFGRNVADDRPHLGPGLVAVAPEPRGRLASLAMLIVPYRTIRDVDEGVAMTRDVLRATIDLARSRASTPIIVVPQLGPEDEVERALRHRILDEGGIPYVWVAVDGAWRLAWDRHPNPRAAQAIAAAIAMRLHAAGNGA
jgi:hypothetical protein